jgi:hypothetical protein
MGKRTLTLRRLRHNTGPDVIELRYTGQPQCLRLTTRDGASLLLWRYFDGNTRVATLVIRKGNEAAEAAEAARLNNAWPAFWEITEDSDLEGCVYLTENGTDVDALSCSLSWPEGLDRCFRHPDDNRAFESWVARLPEAERQAVQNWERDARRAVAEEYRRQPPGPVRNTCKVKRRPHREKGPARKIGTPEQRKADIEFYNCWLGFKKNAPHRSTIKDFVSVNRDGYDAITCKRILARVRLRKRRQAEVQNKRPWA